uniref:Uncharacterized protein n=1 Tax=Oryza meridionalis TaxID=40149 RepID=A0A0E0C9Y8_9ORYZ
MEYSYPCNSCSCNKEKRPPLKRGQLKLQIAKALGSLVGSQLQEMSVVVPGGKNWEPQLNT